MPPIITTTGTAAIVELEDLSGFILEHPNTIDLGVYFGEDDIANSDDLEAKIASGALTMVETFRSPTTVDKGVTGQIVRFEGGPVDEHQLVIREAGFEDMISAEWKPNSTLVVFNNLKPAPGGAEVPGGQDTYTFIVLAGHPDNQDGAVFEIRSESLDPVQVFFDDINKRFTITEMDLQLGENLVFLNPYTTVSAGTIAFDPTGPDIGFGGTDGIYYADNGGFGRYELVGKTTGAGSSSWTFTDGTFNVENASGYDINLNVSASGSSLLGHLPATLYNAINIRNLPTQHPSDLGVWLPRRQDNEPKLLISTTTSETEVQASWWVSNRGQMHGQSGWHMDADDYHITTVKLDSAAIPLVINVPVAGQWVDVVSATNYVSANDAPWLVTLGSNESISPWLPSDGAGRIGAEYVDPFFPDNRGLTFIRNFSVYKGSSQVSIQNTNSAAEVTLQLCRYIAGVFDEVIDEKVYSTFPNDIVPVTLEGRVNLQMRFPMLPGPPPLYQIGVRLTASAAGNQTIYRHTTTLGRFF